MKIKVNRNELTQGLQKVTNIISDGIIPILSNVVFNAEGDKLKLVASDIERRITTTIPAEIEEAGSIAFDYLLLDRPTLFLDIPAPFKKGFSLKSWLSWLSLKLA